MNKQQVLDNIEIARKHLLSLHLLIPDDILLFDCYCLPSFRWKAFYSQIYMTNGAYRANCAYTHYADYLGVESYSVHFTSIEKDRHTAKTTDVICKTIFPAPDVIRALFKYANDVTSIDRFENESTVMKHLQEIEELQKKILIAKRMFFIAEHMILSGTRMIQLHLYRAIQAKHRYSSVIKRHLTHPSTNH